MLADEKRKEMIIKNSSHEKVVPNLRIANMILKDVKASYGRCGVRSFATRPLHAGHFPK